MKTLSVDFINEKFGTNVSGEEIGYGERGLRFREVECDNLEDFDVNGEIGQCWTNAKNETYFKIKNNYGEAETFII